MTNIQIENVAKNDIIRINDSNKCQVATAVVQRVTKTQIIASSKGTEIRFRVSDGKQVQSNGKVVTDVSRKTVKNSVIRL